MCLWVTLVCLLVTVADCVALPPSFPPLPPRPPAPPGQLAVSVSAEVGAAALPLLHIVLHLSDEHAEHVLQELQDYKCFG